MGHVITAATPAEALRRSAEALSSAAEAGPVEAAARPYPSRLLAHPADREVGSVMTADLFRRLTRRPGADAGASGASDPARYTYTPRKVLRRVLDLEEALLAEAKGASAR